MWPFSRRHETAVPARRASGEVRTLDLGDEVEAFVHGRLDQLYQASGHPSPRWVDLNLLAHGSLEDLEMAMVTEGRSRRATDSAWSYASGRLAGAILSQVHDAEDLRRVQEGFLWPLEAELIEARHGMVLSPGELFRLTVGALAPLFVITDDHQETER